MGPCGNCCALVVLTALALPVDASAETTTLTIDPWTAQVTPNIAAPWTIEIGSRYWYSVGSYDYNYFSDAAGSARVSALKYDGATANSGELFFRVDHRSGLFTKGYIGAGSIGGGRLIDEDFPPLTAPYSRTSSRLEGDIDYLDVDAGYTIHDGSTTSAAGTRVGVFVGYHDWMEKQNAFGCKQIATNQYVCPPSSVLATDKVITEQDKWRSERVGLVADEFVSPQLRISGEVAYVHTDQDALDIHYFTFGHDPANGDGQGFQLEGVLSYNPTQAFNVGVGGRWWHLETDALDAFRQKIEANTDRYGAFVQGSLRLE